MIMNVHLLTGEALKGLARVPVATHAAALGPEIVPVPAFWLSPRVGRYDHGFLRDPAMDDRVRLFAEALLRDFGRRKSPLLILPDLDPEEAGAPLASAAAIPASVIPVQAPPHPAAPALPAEERAEGRAEETLLDEPGPEEVGPEDAVPVEPGGETGPEEPVPGEPPGPRRWLAVLEELQAVATTRGCGFRFLLRSVALEPVLPREDALARLVRVAGRLEAAGLSVAIPEGAVVLPEPESRLHTAILRNLRAQYLMEEMAAIGRRQGLEIADPAKLLAYCDRSLQHWAEIGLAPALADRAAFARLGERLLDRLPHEPRALP